MTDNKSAKIVLEREYNVPLRRKWLLVPKYKRAKKAIKTLKDFIAKHMKADNVKIGRYLNMNIWKDGIKNPPHHVLVIAKKDEEGLVVVELKAAPTNKKVQKTEKVETKDKPAKEEVVEAEVIEEVKEVETKKSEVKEDNKSEAEPPKESKEKPKKAKE